MKLLVMGQNEDPHVKEVLSVVSRSHFSNIKVFDQWDLQRASIVIDGNNEKVILDNDTIKNDDDLLIWWRIKPYMGNDAINFDDSIQALYWDTQWRALQYSIVKILHKAKTVNDVAAMQAANYKPFQLVMAKKVGLKVPPSAISNDSRQITKLGSKIFFKHLVNKKTSEKGSTYTAIVSNQEVKSNEVSIASCPSIYQSVLQKNYELRVCIFGKKIYTFKIDSQSKRGTQSDWRIGSLTSDMLSYYNLPDEIVDKLLKFQYLMGLRYGIYDIVVDTDGNYIFLEVNPDGQWLWIQRLIGYDLSGAFAKMLESINYEYSN